MRILHVIASLAPRYGGPSVACPAFCRELARRGHEVFIYTTNVDGRRHMDVPLGQPVIDSDVEICFFPGWTFPPEFKFSFALWRALGRTIPAVDVVHIYSMYIFSATAAAHFCRKFRVPYVLHPHGSLDPYLLRRHALRKRLYSRLFERRKFQDAAAILFNSADEMRLASDWLDGVVPQRSQPGAPFREVIPIGVEEECFNPPRPEAQAHFRQRFPELAGKRILLFFGRLSFKKGMDILTQAFVSVAREQKDVHLLLAGPDTEGYGEKVREWLKASGMLEKATFTGALSGEDRFLALREAEVFALPSYSENFGQAVAEAMACGVPVVVSDRVNISPAVQAAEAGLVVPCDAQRTAAALLQLLRNPALRRQMGARGRRWARENLAEKAVGERMVRLYERIVRQAGAENALRAPLEEHTVL